MRPKTYLRTDRRCGCASDSGGIAELILPNLQDAIAEHIADLLVPQTQEPDARAQQQTVGLFADVPFSVVMDEVAEVVIVETVSRGSTNRASMFQRHRLKRKPPSRYSSTRRTVSPIASMSKSCLRSRFRRKTSGCTRKKMSSLNRSCAGATPRITLRRVQAQGPKRKGGRTEWLRAAAVPGAICRP